MKYLELQRCELLPTCSQRLADALKQNTRLLRINLGENFIGEGGAWHLGRMLQANTSLQELELQGNDMEMPSGRIFGKALEQNSHLTRLGLRYNYLEPEGTRRLFEGLQKNKTLQELDLQGNGMDTEELAVLERVLGHHPSLSILNVSGCSLGDTGMRRISAALSQQTCRLRTLHIRANFVTEVGARAIEKALGHKSSLQELDLSMNQIPERLQKGLQQAWGPRDGLNVSNQFDAHDDSEDDTFVLQGFPGEAITSSSSSSSSEGDDEED